jgi:hypothetical protein
MSRVYLPFRSSSLQFKAVGCRTDDSVVRSRRFVTSRIAVTNRLSWRDAGLGQLLKAHATPLNRSCIHLIAVYARRFRFKFAVKSVIKKEIKLNALTKPLKSMRNTS